MIIINPLTPSDRPWVQTFLAHHAGSVRMVSRGQLRHADTLPGFMGLLDDQPAALLTYHVANDELEVFTLHASIEGQGLGSGLLNAAVAEAKRRGCRRVWLITTNDNTQAMRFYQKRGFVLSAVYPNALAASRRLKPEIPLIGHDGIPLRDEIEFEIVL